MRTVPKKLTIIIWHLFCFLVLTVGTGNGGLELNIYHWVLTLPRALSALFRMKVHEPQLIPFTSNTTICSSAKSVLQGTTNKNTNIITKDNTLILFFNKCANVLFSWLLRETHKATQWQSTSTGLPVWPPFGWCVARRAWYRLRHYWGRVVWIPANSQLPKSTGQHL